MSTNIVGYCPICKTHRQLKVENGEYECQSCQHTWDCMVFKPDAILYVALVSHDDEETVVPLRICDTAEDAKHACKLAAIENGDEVPLNWNEGEPASSHSRLDGEFWTATINRDHYDTVIYYVRPAKLQ